MPAPAPYKTYEEIKATRKMRWWYESLADYMIANPQKTQMEIATHFGRAPMTISTIVNTDAFKAYFRQRRAQMAENIDASVRAKLLGVAETSLDLMLSKLDKQRDSLPISTLQKTAETALKSLGYGASAPPGVSVNVHNNPSQPTVVAVPVDISTLETAREAIRRSQLQALEAPPVIEPKVIEHEPLPANVEYDGGNHDDVQ